MNRAEEMILCRKRYGPMRPRAYCGRREQPGVTQISAALDWTHQETTPDQARIETVLETLPVTGASLLYGGGGNSRFAEAGHEGWPIL